MVYFINAALLHAKLYPVDSVANAEPRIDNSLDHCYSLLVGGSRILVIESSHGDKQLTQMMLLENEVIHGNT